MKINYRRKQKRKKYIPSRCYGIDKASLKKEENSKRRAWDRKVISNLCVDYTENEDILFAPKFCGDPWNWD